MKTFLSILGGLSVVGLFAAFVVGMAISPKVVGLTVAALCVAGCAVAFFYLGYTFTRDVILG